MLHRRQANRRRLVMNRGIFRRGPNASLSEVRRFSRFLELLAEHATDNDSDLEFTGEQMHNESSLIPDQQQASLILETDQLIATHNEGFPSPKNAFAIQIPSLQLQHEDTRNRMDSLSAHNGHEHRPGRFHEEIDDRHALTTRHEPFSIADGITEYEEQALIPTQGRGIEELGQLSNNMEPADITGNVAENDCTESPEQRETSELNVVGLSDPNFSSNIQGLSEWLISRLGLLQVYLKHGLESTVMDDLLSLLGAPCKSWKTILRAVKHFSGFQNLLQTFAVCPGHALYISWVGCDSFSHSCPECCQARPANIQDAFGRVVYIPILPRIKQMVRNEEVCGKLYSYSQAPREKDGTLRDIYDASLFDELCTQYGGAANIANDIFLGISMDGFSVYKNSNYDVWSLVALNLNLAPERRYLTRNVIPLCFIPGPSQPKQLQSFLIPLIEEVEMSVEDGGVDMTFFDGSLRKVRLHILYFSGDQPAVSKASGLTGCNGKSPCQDCRIQGFYSQSARHYYFPSKIRQSSGSDQFVTFFDNRDLPIRSEIESKQVVEQVGRSTGIRRSVLQRDTGIRERSLICSLPTMHEYRSFTHDVMHLFYNIQQLLLQVWIGSYNVNGISISAEAVSYLDEEFQNWRYCISTQIVVQ